MPNIFSNVKNHPPLTMVMLGSAILLLQGSKSILIGSLPIGNEVLKASLNGWFTYLLDASGVIIALANIFMGKSNNNQSN